MRGCATCTSTRASIRPRRCEAVNFCGEGSERGLCHRRINFLNPKSQFTAVPCAEKGSLISFRQNLTFDSFTHFVRQTKPASKMSTIPPTMTPWLPFPTPSRWVTTRSHSTHAPLIPSIRAHLHPLSLLLSPQFERHGHPVIRARCEHALFQPPCSAAAAALARHGLAPAALARCGRHRPRVTELSDDSSTWL